MSHLDTLSIKQCHGSYRVKQVFILNALDLHLSIDIAHADYKRAIMAHSMLHNFFTDMSLIFSQ